MKQKTKYKQTEIGKIPKDWEVKKIEDVVDVNMGQSPPGESYNEKGNGINFLQGVRTFGKKYPLFDTYTTCVTKKAEAGSVLLSVRAPVGEINVAKESLCIGRGLASLNMKNGNNEFLYYLLKKFSSLIRGRETGSVFGSINSNQIKNLILPFPKNSIEQKAIAKILSDLDAKIELNSRTNQILESLGRVLFKKWFINLEKIPKGWKNAKLRDFISLNRGLSYKGSGLSEEGIPMVNLGTMAPNHGFLYGGLKHYKGEFKERNLVQIGDVVVANTDITQRRDVLGSPAIVPNNLGSNKILFTHHIYAVRNNSKIPNLFIYYLLQSKEYKGRARGFATGTTVLALPEEAVLDLEFIVPDDETLEKSTKFLSTIQNTIYSNINESQRLSKIRDALLPKLMNGEIRVK